MSKYIDYKPIHVDEIDYNKCKWLYNEVCCCADSPYVADYPNSNMCKSKKDCEFFEKEDFKESMKGIYTTSVVEETIDEAPFVYKPMQEILDNIKDTVEVERIIKPIYNFKSKN